MLKNLAVLILVIVFLASKAVIADQASAATIDGFNVTFNSLPTNIDTSGLSPDSVTLSGVSGKSSYYYGMGPSNSGTYWGQANPFNYNSALSSQGSIPSNGGGVRPMTGKVIYDAIWNGNAAYKYASPQTSFSILWGTTDGSNAISFFNENHGLIGTINGTDLISAIKAASLISGTQVYGGANNQYTIDITVSIPAGFSYAEITGGSDLTFEYSNIAVAAPAPLPATHFSVSAPLTAAAGTPFNFTVTALDQSNNTANGYSGTVHFTSSDTAAVLPADATLANGTGTFPATLKTIGNRTITATDTLAASITGSSGAISVIEGVTLTIAFAGNGSGTVTSTSPDSGINCIKGSPGDCSASYSRNTSVTLAATGDWKSLFIDWSGDISSIANPVTFNMSVSRGVTAKFDLNFQAKLLPGGAFFASIQDAYASVSSGSITILAKAYSFQDDLLFGNDTTVTLTGGMDSNYITTSGYSSVNSLIVGKGSAVIGNIIIK